MKPFRKWTSPIEPFRSVRNESPGQISGRVRKVSKRCVYSNGERKGFKFEGKNEEICEDNGSV